MNCTENAPFIFIFLLFSFAAVLGLEWEHSAKCTLARHNPPALSSFLSCKEKCRSAKSLLYGKEQLQEIWRSDRGFGSTFRKQKAKRQHSFKFQTYFLLKLKPTPPSNRHLFLLNAFLFHTYKIFPDLMPWHFHRSDSARRARLLLEVLENLWKDAWKQPIREQSWGMNKGQRKAALRWEKKKVSHIGCCSPASNIISHLHSPCWGFHGAWSFLWEFTEIGKVLWVTQTDWEEESWKSWSHFSLAKHTSICLKLSFFLPRFWQQLQKMQTD